DYYNIALKDRVILSTEIGATDAGDTALDDILTTNNLSDLSFFVNALDTRTSGIDFVASYRDLPIGGQSIDLNLSGNYTLQNEREGEVNNPELVEAAGQTVSNPTQEALFFTSRPEYKAIFGIDYRLNKLGLSLNNTLFGPTTFRQQGLDSRLYTEFQPKVVTDLALTYPITENVLAALNVNNIFDVLPEWEFKADPGAEDLLTDEPFLMNQSNLITFNQRYSQMTYDGYHFSQLGTIFNLSVTVRL
ncbi:MAG: TonB-dependent receptor, partial [Lewinella sp.]